MSANEQPIRKDLVARYTGGMCDALALALTQTLRKPLGLMGYYEEEDGEKFEVPTHAFVYTGRLRQDIIDALGERPLAAALAAPMTPNGVSPDSIRWHRQATWDEVRTAFTVEGVSTDQVEQAVEDARALGLLLPAPKIARRDVAPSADLMGF